MHNVYKYKTIKCVYIKIQIISRFYYSINLSIIGTYYEIIRVHIYNNIYLPKFVIILSKRLFKDSRIRILRLRVPMYNIYL